MRRAIKVLLSTPILVGVVVLVSLYPRYGMWLGKAFPVASTIEWVSFSPDGGKGSGGWQLVEFRTTKYYDWCRYVSMRIWWRDDEDRIYRIPWMRPTENQEQDENRPAGDLHIRIRIGSTLPVEHWRVDVTHDCHPLLPNITTVIWP